MSINEATESAPSQLRTKVKLSPQLAREIYAIQEARSMQKHAIFQRKISAAAVARQFSVTEKAVRDIWKGRTWRREIEAHANQNNKIAELHLVQKCRSKAIEAKTFQKLGLFQSCESNVGTRRMKLEPSSPPDSGFDSMSSDHYVECHSSAEYQQSEFAQHCNKTMTCWQPSLPCPVVPATFDLPSCVTESDPFYDDWPYWVQCPQFVRSQG
mmetsp:Transcript_15488/g.42012  ORF Transcript_15488/g.42012 Transcript_15488/m.42012 type:complete len:212 (+) Transcript_15488:72-707(+)